jgi:hypothetical protein
LLETLEDRQNRLWRWASFSIGAQLGNLEGGSSIGDFERWIKGAVGMERVSLKGSVGRAPLLGTPKNMLSKALEWMSPEGPHFWGT